jgi:hypothetical protein
VESATYDQISVASVYYCYYFLTCPAAGSGAGNVSALPPLDALRKHKVGMEFRRFVRPGVYAFQSRPFHAHGVIHVE